MRDLLDRLRGRRTKAQQAEWDALEQRMALLEASVKEMFAAVGELCDTIRANRDLRKETSK